MKDFAFLMLLMVIGAAFVLFAKGALKARAEGSKFNFEAFLRSNLNRLQLLVFGLIVGGLALFFDPIGLQKVFDMLPLGMQFGSPLVVGAALAGAVLIVPEKKEGDPNEKQPPQ